MYVNSTNKMNYGDSSNVNKVHDNIKCNLNQNAMIFIQDDVVENVCEI